MCRIPRYLQATPELLDQALRIHAIPMKKMDEALVAYLTRAEVRALLDAPDRQTQSGIRDRAMLHLAFAAGLRVSELVGLMLDQFGRAPASAHVIGKGRRERVLSLWQEDCGGDPCLDCDPAQGRRHGAVPEQCGPDDDPLRVRIYPDKARRRRGPPRAFACDEVGVAACTAA